MPKHKTKEELTENPNYNTDTSMMKLSFGNLDTAQIESIADETLNICLLNNIEILESALDGRTTGAHHGGREPAEKLPFSELKDKSFAVRRQALELADISVKNIQSLTSELRKRTFIIHETFEGRQSYSHNYTHLESAPDTVLEDIASDYAKHCKRIGEFNLPFVPDARQLLPQALTPRHTFLLLKRRASLQMIDSMMRYIEAIVVLLLLRAYYAQKLDWEKHTNVYIV